MSEMRGKQVRYSVENNIRDREIKEETDKIKIVVGKCKF
jgi:hypothetical protein